MSQSLQISNGSGTLTNGAELYVYGDSGSATIMDISLSITNISCGTVTAKAKEIPDSLITGAKVSLCFAGSCYGQYATTFISPSSATLAASAENSTFTGDYHPLGHLGESTVIFEFFNVANVDDSSWVVVHFDATPAGIKQITSVNAEISNPYPNPASDFTSFNCSLPKNTGKAKLVISNILGSEVKEMNIEKEGKITLNTRDLMDGVYLYSFIFDDKRLLTKRLIIQH
jgi:hypothetical protein